MVTSTLPTRCRTGSSRGRRRDTLANRHAPAIIGTLTVTVLAVAMVVAWWLPGSRWSVGPAAAVVSFPLTPDWLALARLHMLWLIQAVLALGGALTPLGVAYWKNLNIAVPLMGITLVALAAAAILDAPVSRDHSVRRTSGHWGSTALGAALVPPAICFLVVIPGSIWVFLTVHERWSGIVPMAALIVVIGATSVRFGCSAKVGVAFAMIAGLVVGLVVALITWSLGQTSDLLPVTFPFIAKRFGELAAFLTLGSVTGFSVGLAVSVVDALLGERTSSAELANILGCGAAKLLVATLSVHAVIHISGI